VAFVCLYNQNGGLVASEVAVRTTMNSLVQWQMVFQEFHAIRRWETPERTSQVVSALVASFIILVFHTPVLPTVLSLFSFSLLAS
jgi:hypothetical protein